MSLHIDPKALNSFATDAAGHSAQLKSVRFHIDLDSLSLGKFAEADLLTTTLNAHTVEVNQRLQATSQALWGLSQAAASAATLAGASDDDITAQMKKINHQIDDARAKLGPHAS